MFITKRWPVNRKAVGTCRTCHIATFTRPPAPAPNTFATRPRYTTCFCSVRRKIRNVSQYKYVLALPSLTISLIFVKRDMQNQNHKRARSLIAAHLRSAANNSAPCSELGSLLARKQCKVTGKLKDFLDSCDEFRLSFDLPHVCFVHLANVMIPSSSPLSLPSANRDYDGAIPTMAIEQSEAYVLVDDEASVDSAKVSILSPLVTKSLAAKVVVVNVLCDASNRPALVVIGRQELESIWILDVVKVGLHTSTSFLSALVGDCKVKKVIVNIACAVPLLTTVSRNTLMNVFDAQVGFELLGHGPLHDISSMAKALGSDMASNKKPENEPGNFAVSHARKKMAAKEARAFLEVYGPNFNDQNPLLAHWKEISFTKAMRCSALEDPIQASSALGFRTDTFNVASVDVLNFQEVGFSTQVSTHNEEEEIDALLRLLPESWAQRVRQEPRMLIDIEIDVGRFPQAVYRTGGPLCLSSSERDVVSLEQIQVFSGFVTSLTEGIGIDNRAGLSGYLHRISVMRSDRGQIIGATLRVGRHFTAVASIFADVLLSEDSGNGSILLLGPPGSGKTSILRDVARTMAENGHRVMIVDSSNEIGGPGIAAHGACGKARRMMVPYGKDNLKGKLIEALQNHTPGIICVDELSNDGEMQAAGTAKERGVRLIASAHGDLRSLVKNLSLRSAVGGVQAVTIGDNIAASKATAGQDGGSRFRKSIAERKGAPIFDVIIELGIDPHDLSACRVVRDTASAVDDILEGKQYKCQIRRRAPNGDLFFTPHNN